MWSHQNHQQQKIVVVLGIGPNLAHKYNTFESQKMTPLH